VPNTPATIASVKKSNVISINAGCKARDFSIVFRKGTCCNTFTRRDAISGTPVRKSGQQLFWLPWIIGAQMNDEFMLTIHAFVHHILERYGSLLSGLYSRQTDDSARRSTPLDKLNAGFSQDLQRLVPHIAYTEYGINRRTEFDIPMIQGSARNGYTWRATHLWSEIRLLVVLTRVTCPQQEKERTHDQQNAASDNDPHEARVNATGPMWMRPMLR
jgi:hypothetical protein